MMVPAAAYTEVGILTMVAINYSIDAFIFSSSNSKLVDIQMQKMMFVVIIFD